MSNQCVLLILDAGPVNSLWVAGRLDLIEKIGLPVVIVDEVYAELISDPENYEKDRDVKSFFEKAAFVTIEKTFTGEHAAADRAAGKKVKKNLGETAIAEFLSDFEPGSGINKYTKPSESVLLLFEDSGIPFVKIIRSSSNIHLLSTVAMLRGLEEEGEIESADEIIRKMTNPGNSAH